MVKVIVYGNKDGFPRLEFKTIIFVELKLGDFDMCDQLYLLFTDSMLC